MLLQVLKLPHNEKSSLPAAVQYLDRGGLTFMRLPFTQWMKSTEEKITSLLNQKNYAVYGAKIFEVHACMCMCIFTRCVCKHNYCDLHVYYSGHPHLYGAGHNPTR